MKITIESTTQLVDVNGVPARAWEGRTETGIRVYCLITRIAVHNDDANNPAIARQFETDLQEQKAPSSRMLEAFPTRMIL